MDAEEPRRPGLRRFWLLVLLLFALDLLLFAPFKTCALCEGSGSYVSIRRQKSVCPVCDGSKRLGYGLMFWKSTRLSRY